MATPTTRRAQNQDCFEHEAKDQRGHHVFEVIGDEDSANVQFDLLIHASVFVEGFGWLVDGDKEERFEGDFSFSNKVSMGHGSVGIFGD